MIRFKPVLSFLFLMLICLEKPVACAAEYGNLTGQFLFDGKPPKRKIIKFTKDLHVCGKVVHYDESLIVGSDGGVANVVVYLEKEDGIVVHPDYRKTKDAEVTMRIRNCRFEPHILPIRLTQTLVMSSADSIVHGCNVPPDHLFLLLPGASVKMRVKQLLGPAIPISCITHNYERAYVVPRKTPYIAVSGKNGKFTIRNLPAGKELHFRAWHEGRGWLNTPDWKKGKFKVTIPVDSGRFDIGKVMLTVKQLALQEVSDRNIRDIHLKLGMPKLYALILFDSLPTEDGSTVTYRLRDGSIALTFKDARLTSWRVFRDDRRPKEDRPRRDDKPK